MNSNNMAKKERPLREYIKDYISVSRYFDCINQIVKMLEKLQGEGIQLILDIKQMKVVDEQIQFQLITEESVYESEKIKNFLKSFTFDCVFGAEENCEKVSEFLRYLDASWDGRDFNGIKRFVNGGNAGDLSEGTNAAAYQVQMPADGETGVLDVTYWSNLQQKYNKQMPADGETGVLDVTYWDDLEQKCNAQGNNGETGVLDPSFWDNALHNTPSQQLKAAPRVSRVPKLVHNASGKATPITKASFWIGKEDVDLVVAKDVISRRHAEIITRGNHYFIVDNNSTNKTYVEGKAIAPKASVEIYDGTKIKFVDEEYTFSID